MPTYSITPEMKKINAEQLALQQKTTVLSPPGTPSRVIPGQNQFNMTGTEMPGMGPLNPQVMPGSSDDTLNKISFLQSNPDKDLSSYGSGVNWTGSNMNASGAGMTDWSKEDPNFYNTAQHPENAALMRQEQLKNDVNRANTIKDLTQLYGIQSGQPLQQAHADYYDTQTDEYNRTAKARQMEDELSGLSKAYPLGIPEAVRGQILQKYGYDVNQTAAGAKPQGEFGAEVAAEPKKNAISRARDNIVDKFTPPPAPPNTTTDGSLRYAGPLAQAKRARAEEKQSRGKKKNEKRGYMPPKMF